jgi:ABC-type sulfate transport system permease subunit
VLAEVAGAISRTRQDPARAQAFATVLGQLPNVTVVPLDMVLGQQALELAAQHGLRGTDAVYEAVAQPFSTTPVLNSRTLSICLRGVQHAVGRNKHFAIDTTRHLSLRYLGM